MKMFDVILLVTMVTLVKGAATNIAQRVAVEESCLDFWGHLSLIIHLTGLDLFSVGRMSLWIPTNVCSNRGLCTFGVCRCDEGAMGRVCEDSPYSVGWCTRLKPCVQCREFRTGPLTPEECYHQCYFETSRIAFQLVYALRDDARRCRFVDDDDCGFQFTYAFRPEEKDMIVRTLRTKECPPLGR